MDAADPDFGKSFTLEFLNGTTLDATGLIGDGPVTDASGNLTPAFAPGALADSTALVTALEATDQIDAVVDVNGDGSELQVTYAATTPEDFTFTLESTNSTLTNTNGAQVRAVADDGTVVLDTTTYEAGATLAFGGVSITLDGEPAIGDEIQIRPADADAANQDLFKTLKDAIDVLELDQEDLDANYAHVRNTISSTMRELDNGLDNLLTRRASVGARLNELDIVDSASGSRAMSYDKTMSDLIDLDYGEAVTEYSLRQVGLQAAQRAYVDIQGMSLFDFMR
jgi:flagellin-like hook-associated protein FlgL